MSRWRTRLFRAVAPVRFRQWLRRKWQVVRSPRAWWERLADPVWRWRHGQARPWEASVGRFFQGMWEGVATVFERGDPREEGYWKKKYGFVREWEKSLIALVLGSWLVLAAPFRHTLIPRMPETVNYPDPGTSGTSGTDSNDGEGRPMSVYEEDLTEKAEIFANAIEEFCSDAPMMELADALFCLTKAESKIGRAFANLAKRMRDEMPLNEDFIEGVDLVSEAHYDIAKMCEELPNSFQISHEADIDRVENPRPSEELWDPMRNRG